MNSDVSLASGVEVDHYLIVKPINQGGFGVVYLAVDKSNKQKVIIKEYMPRHEAKRLRNNQVVPVSKQNDSIFQKGRKMFFQEANILATLHHENIVKVLNFFRANGTAYMVMEYEKGDNLQEYIQKHGGRMSERFMLTVFPGMLDALRTIHTQGFLHLDIKPGNVHIRPGGRPLILDFGTVHRRELSRQHQPGHVITAGYTPIEQLNKSGYVGPWTDLYALGATMRTCLDGHPPTDADIRHASDNVVKAAQQYRKHYPIELLQAMDWCMEVDPELRPQSIEQLLEKFPLLTPKIVESTPPSDTGTTNQRQAS